MVCLAIQEGDGALAPGILIHVLAVVAIDGNLIACDEGVAVAAEAGGVYTITVAFADEDVAQIVGF